MTTNTTDTTDTKPAKEARHVLSESDRYGGGVGGDRRLDPALPEARVRVRVQKAEWGPRCYPLCGYLIEDNEACDVVVYAREFNELKPRLLADAEEANRQRIARERFVNAMCVKDGPLYARICGVKPEYEGATVHQIKELVQRAEQNPSDVDHEILKAIADVKKTTSDSPQAHRHKMSEQGEAPAGDPSIFVIFEVVEDLLPPKSTVRREHELGALEQQHVIAAAVGKSVAEQLAAVFGPLLAQLNPNATSKQKDK
jgi:hypothetical protein